MTLVRMGTSFLALGAFTFLLMAFQVVQVGPCTDTGGALSLLTVLVATPVGITCLAVHFVRMLTRE
jgi:hypothetical protein